MPPKKMMTSEAKSQGDSGRGTGTGSKIVYFICPICEWRMREPAIPIVNWYQLALIYLITRENKGNSKGENGVVVLILWFTCMI